MTTAFGVGAAEIPTSVQIAMNADLPYRPLRDAILTHPTLVEGLIPLFSSPPSVRNGELRARLKQRLRLAPEFSYGQILYRPKYRRISA